MQKGQTEAGQRMVLKAISTDGAEPYFYKNLAQIYRSEGHYQQARDCLQIARDNGYADQYDDEVDVLLEELFYV